MYPTLIRKFMTSVEGEETFGKKNVDFEGSRLLKYEEAPPLKRRNN